jgi:hypothetical protein
VDLASGVSSEDLVPLPEFLHTFLLQKYGLPSLLEGHMYSIVETTQVCVMSGRGIVIAGAECVCVRVCTPWASAVVVLPAAPPPPALGRCK